MTCAHALGLIDAGPFAGYTPAHLAAAFEHARACPTCGPALAASRALDVGVAALPQVDAPPDLEKAVMARVARLEGPHAAASTADPAWTAGAVIVGTVTAAVAVAIELSVTWKLLTPRPDTVLALLVVSLVIYTAGLFAPLTTLGRHLRGN